MLYEKPKVVVFCGSSRFVDIMAVAAWLAEREEKAIAIGLHLLPHWYRSPSGELPADHLAEHEGCAAEMDSLHLRKIDLCDEVFVVNYGGYVGESTDREIQYAVEKGKPLRWYTFDPIGDQVETLLRSMSEVERKTESAIFEAQRNDPTLWSIFKVGGSAKEAILALLADKTRLMNRVMELENIAPRKMRLEDGRIATWRCPDDLIPELSISGGELPPWAK